MNLTRAISTARNGSGAALLIAAGMVGAGAQTASECVGSTAVVCTETGAVRGSVAGAVRAFKGIPYAKPPVDDLRFQPPQPAVRWQGILEADRFGPVCPQTAAPGGTVTGSEDCLRLNIWTPARPSAALLPVMVWLTGGGNSGLSGAGTASFGGVVYDGSLMVERGGVVFVTYNLRLGVLGFLAHPALDAERPEKISGNYGSLVAATTDAYFSCTSRRVARTLISVQREPVYRYFFSHALESDPELRAAGAAHTIEHSFFYPWSGTYTPSSGELKLQDAMILYWSRMARTSDPNGPGTPTWPRYEDGRDLYLELATPPGAKSDLHKAQCDFWDTIVLPWPHL